MRGFFPRRSQRQPGRRTRLICESLEPRRLLATYFVNGLTGNNGNTGLSPGQAFLTIQHAVNVAASASGADTVRVMPKPGPYVENVTVADSSGDLFLSSTTGNPNHVTIDASGGIGIDVSLINDVSIFGISATNGTAGFRASGSSDLSLARVIGRNNSIYGIDVLSAGDVAIARSEFTQNSVGANVVNFNDAVFDRVTVKDNLNNGAHMALGNHATVTRSLATANGANGMIFQLISADITVHQTRLTKNLGNGLSTQFSNDVFISRSEISDNRLNGMRSWDVGAVTVTGTTVEANQLGFGWNGFMSTSVDIYGSRFDDNGNTGIRLDRAGPVDMTKVSVKGNNGGWHGGGILVTDPAVHPVSISRSSIRLNQSAAHGGGVAVLAPGDLRVVSTDIVGNAANQNGGGLHKSGGNLATVTVDQSNISRNKSGGAGGGIHALAMQLAVSETTVDSNGSAGQGGGVYFAGLRFASDRSTVSRNQAQSAGGIAVMPVAAGQVQGHVTNSTVSSNRATSTGGGIVSGAGQIRLRNATITLNAALNGGGYDVLAGSSVISQNTIIAENKATATFGLIAHDYSGAVLSQGYNLIGDGTGSSGFTATGDQVGTAATPINPQLQPLQNNGGLTETHALKAISPALDGGSNALAPPIDQRGIARPQDGNGDAAVVADIGAVEMLPGTAQRIAPLNPIVVPPLSHAVSISDDNSRRDAVDRYMSQLSLLDQPKG